MSSYTTNPSSSSSSNLLSHHHHSSDNLEALSSPTRTSHSTPRTPGIGAGAGPTSPTASPSPSRRTTPPNPAAASSSSPAINSPPTSPTASSFLASSVSSLFGGLMRRFSSDPSPQSLNPTSAAGQRGVNGGGGGYPFPAQHAYTFHPDGDRSKRNNQMGTGSRNGGSGGGYPFDTSSPPPLEPVQLVGFAEDTRQEARLLTPQLAEEIRLMVPARLGIVDEWRLVYSLEQDGASLATLYEKCARYQGVRVGFVLCVRDCEGGLFGAYLSDRPHPAPKYFGTGECFLWRASVLPPPAATTTNSSNSNSSSSPNPPAAAAPTFRFKAYPYSGINEYYILCETHFLSLGAGDGKYGLWLDDSLERGVSATSQTFGNEPLSEEGEKFGVLGVEVWVIGG
ncbi:hypothetical protein VTJ04DRAFT_10671 [Mycothermus thermophilus]|uniref:uncharacterized protein n=1 Tax=Humicola insolens TaxID=85995 RepID=UPI0037440EBE